MKPTYALLLSLLFALSAAAQPPTAVPSAETHVPESAAPLMPGPWADLPPEVRALIPPEEWSDRSPDGVEQRPFEGWRLPPLGGESRTPWRQGSLQRPAGAWQQRRLFQTQSAERARQQVSILLQPMPARIGQTEWKRSRRSTADLDPQPFRRLGGRIARCAHAEFSGTARHAPAPRQRKRPIEQQRSAPTLGAAPTT